MDYSVEVREIVVSVSALILTIPLVSLTRLDAAEAKTIESGRPRVHHVADPDLVASSKQTSLEEKENAPTVTQPNHLGVQKRTCHLPEQDSWMKPRLIAE